MSGFNEALSFLLLHEGGFVSIASDPGGVTNLGVTKKAWEAYVGHPVTIDDMRGLTAARVAPFYRKNYWDAIHGDDLPPGIAYCVFDCAVNSGVTRAVKWLQKAVDANVDGKMGQKTIDAVEFHTPSTVIDEICDMRLDFMRSLPTWNVFGKGWKRRVEEVRLQADSMR